MWKAVKKSSIPYNHAGGKYGLADKYPVSYKERGFLFQIKRSQRIFIPIRIKRHDKYNVQQQVFDTVMFMIE